MLLPHILCSLRHEISFCISLGKLHNLNSTAVNGDIFIKNRQGGAFACEHLYLQISDGHIPYGFFWLILPEE
jgi:hypothetical protein